MKKNKKLNKFWRMLGPGFVTGAADDDPSGVATYSQAGAQYGFGLTWMCLFLLPAMIAIQEMCGRIGLMTGRGLAGTIKKFYSKKLLWMIVSLLAIANVINIGADLGIMAASLQMLLGFPYWYWLILIAGFIIWMEITIPYKKFFKVLKWLSFALVVYIATAFISATNWHDIILSLFRPKIILNPAYIFIMVGFIGTTISPYLFFWQAANEVETKIEDGKIRDFKQAPKITKLDIKKLKTDTRIGMIFSNLISFFIIVTTATTLHKAGITNIETPQQAAEALRPLAGNLSYLLFTVGVIGIGWQSIPVLAGSVGYALAEAFGVREGLSKDFKKAKVFYLIIALATVVGMTMNLLGVNTMRALYVAAVINGVVSIPMIILIIKMANDKRIIGERKSTGGEKIVAWGAFIFVLVAVVLMISNIGIQAFGK